MKKGVIVILIVVALFLVYAFGWLGNEPLFSPFDASVSLANSPPVIVEFLAVFEDNDLDGVDDDGGATTGIGTILGDAGGDEGTGVVNVRFRFVAEDVNGPDDLPGLTGPPIDYVDPGSNLLVQFDAPLSAPVGSTNFVFTEDAGNTCVAVSCVGNSDCPDQTAGTNQKEYVCDITMNYYDPFSPNGGLIAGERWTITAGVKDSTSNLGSAASGLPGFDDLTCTLDNNCDYIIYNQIFGIDTPDAELSWTGISVQTTDQPADSGTGLLLQNAGNVQVNSEDVQAEDLVDPLDSGNIMDVTAFSVGTVLGSNTAGGSGSCDAPGGNGPTGTGGQILDNVPPPVNVVNIIPYDANPFGPGNQANLFFCIWDQLDTGYITGGSASSYGATDPNGWNVVFNS